MRCRRHHAAREEGLGGPRPAAGGGARHHIHPVTTPPFLTFPCYLSLPFRAIHSFLPLPHMLVPRSPMFTPPSLARDPRNSDSD